MWEGQKWDIEGAWFQKWEAAEGENMRQLMMDAPTEASQVMDYLSST